MVRKRDHWGLKRTFNMPLEGLPSDRNRFAKVVENLSVEWKVE